jgi:hypothetical protein
MIRHSGFKPLRPGRIHLRCPGCGRKQSNMPRHPEHDHPTAFMVEILCDNCGAGCKEGSLDYYDKRGRALAAWFGKP